MMGSGRLARNGAASALAILLAGAAAARAQDATREDGQAQKARLSAGGPVPSRDVYLIGTLRVSGAWAEATPGGTGASAYLTIDNRGMAPEQLTGGSLADGPAVPVTGEGAPAGSLTVPPGGTLRLVPGGPHLQADALPADAAPATAPLRGTLRFSRSGTLIVTFATQPPPSAGEEPTPQRAIDLAQ